MPTWEELQEHVRKTYKLQDDEPGYFSLVFRTSEERTQLITVRRVTAFDADWVEFRSAVCRRGQMDPEMALKHNAQFAIGALALDAEKYFILYTIPLSTMDPPEFELPLHVIAKTADSLEGTFTTGDEF
jgi:hypothetical protein